MDAKTFNAPYYDSLNSVQKVMYESGFNFAIKYENYTPAQAHITGVKEVARLERIRNKASKPRMCVNLATGKQFMATENELESMHS